MQLNNKQTLFGANIYMMHSLYYKLIYRDTKRAVQILNLHQTLRIV